ncbi:hypothetical protein JTB14_019594 [Gonioctena quinquepunctata]|nr:hypothetical protein JTB14_019594 [Gonioctena quinquepunctata]
MPFTGNKWDVNKLVPYKDMVNMIKEKWIGFSPLKNGANDTSKAWKVPGYEGQVGFITSMSEHFCGSCNRLRITADGNLKVCLFGNTEISLRDAIRNNCSDDDLTALISAAVKRKKKQHADIKPTPFKIPLPKATITNILHSLPQHKTYLLRNYSTNQNNPKELTPRRPSGKAKMVDTADKAVRERSAKAIATVKVGPQITELIHKTP